MTSTNPIHRIILPETLQNMLTPDMDIIVPESRQELLDLAMGSGTRSLYEVAYDVPGMGRVVEATVARARNGIVVNYMDPYMRRRDPDCLVIADNGDTDKDRFDAKYGTSFEALRGETMDWLKGQELIVMPFMAGGLTYGYPALLVAPANAAFFAGALADLQAFIPASQLPLGFKPKAVIYLAPTFRHTHFAGKQMVVHNRLDDIYELFSYNLYPGPSAKKGVYGILLTIGEQENWVTLHGSAVRISTPYDNVLTVMHEGASGSGKSEMTEEIHRDLDGRIMLSENLISGEKTYLDLKETCELNPIADDMALCHPTLQNASKRLVVTDAEAGWFLRTDHIKTYGTDPYLEKQCIHPDQPLIFLNYDTVPGSTCLLWEHIEDTPGKPCPNPRVILPRPLVKNIIDDAVEIDLRSFGVRTPPCTREEPTYGILGLFHVLPPALAWLWRLVSPRGHNNPSITDTGGGMTSEGVGSYWPFATGRRVDQANLLLDQILKTSHTRYVLIPNQNIGAYKVDFMPQWIAREYLARRGGKFGPHQLHQSRCSLLGFSPLSIKVEGTYLDRELLEVDLQPEVGEAAYDIGAGILTDFFKKELAQFNTPDLDPLGQKIIQCCMDDGTVEDYIKLIPIRY